MSKRLVVTAHTHDLQHRTRAQAEACKFGMMIGKASVATTSVGSERVTHQSMQQCTTPVIAKHHNSDAQHMRLKDTSSSAPWSPCIQAEAALLQAAADTTTMPTQQHLGAAPAQEG